MSAIHTSTLLGLANVILLVPGIAFGASLPIVPLPESTDMTHPAFVQEGVVSDALAGSAPTRAGASPRDQRRPTDRKLARFASLDRVTTDELSGIRGGFFTAAGANFDFGASIRTLVNGQLALQTNLTWTPQGLSVQQLTGLGQSIQSQVQSQVQSSLVNAGITTASGMSSPPSAASNAASATLQLGANAATQQTGGPVPQPTANVATQPTTNVPIAPLATALASVPSVATTNAAASNVQPVANGTPVTISIPAITSGVSIPGASGGSTQVYANLSTNQIQSIIINSASNQAITQNTNVNLTIYNLQQWQQQLAQRSLSSQLVKEVLAATGLGH